MNNNKIINAEVSENIHKINPKQLYAIACAAQYIKKEQIPLLFQNKYLLKTSDFLSDEKVLEVGIYDCAVMYLSRLLVQKLRITETADISLIQNYIAISIKLDKKIDLNLSKAEIINTKERLSKVYQVEFTPGGNTKL